MAESLLDLPKHQRTPSEGVSSQHLGRPSLASGDHRQSNTVSMYVGIGKQKILPKQVTGFPLPTAGRRSESSRFEKTELKSQVRYKKLDATTNDASFSALNPLKQFKRQTLRGKVRAGLAQSKNDRNLKSYLELVEKAQAQFLGYCQAEKETDYAKAAEVIVRLLNYSVDFDLPEQFLRALKVLADYNFHTDKIQQAIFYYNQSREASLLLDHSVLLVESLIGLAQCCGKVGAESEGIKVLKKALEYAWLKGLQELELRIFDEIGRLHYYLGDLQKARQYHSRHINALHQAPSSALRLLSKQRINKCEQIYLQTRYKHIDRILLVHLKVPIKPITEIPLPFPQDQNQEQPIRKGFDLNIKFFAGKQAVLDIKQIIRGWLFRDEIEDPYLPEGDWNTPKPKKYAFIDFQLNQQLKKLEGDNKKEKKKLGKSAFPVKQSLQQQIARIIKEPPMRQDWYESIVRQINRDHRNKLLNVRNAIRIRGFNKKVIPSVEVLKDLYNCLFERSRTFVNQLHTSCYIS